MFRRVISILLIAALALPLAFAESGVTGADVLFGNTTAGSVPSSSQDDSAAVQAALAAMQQEQAAQNAEQQAAMQAEQPQAAYYEQQATYAEPQPTPAPDQQTAASGDDEDIYAGYTETINDYKTLQRGDRDSADGAAYIVMLQNRLKQLGFLNDAADGVYGENTETAVSQFQRLNGLTADGVATPETQARLFSDVSAITTPSPENSIVYGSASVRVQTKLAEWGFLTGSVDGVLGSGSRSAIRTFKKYALKYLPPVPTPTPAPTAAPTPVPTAAPGELPYLFDEPIPTPEPEPTPYEPDSDVDDFLLAYIDGTAPFDLYRAQVQMGDSGDEVKRVQSRLKQLNYLYSNPDGSFGVNTARALLYFQRKHGLPQTAVADEQTQRVLFSSTAQRSEEYVFPYKIYVDISSQMVYCLGWDGAGYNEHTRKMQCSTGKDGTPTPTGTYQSYGQLGEWWYFKDFNCYAQYAYGIVGGILFHSVIYNSSKKLNQSSVYNLGHKASHGCIRLAVDDARWIYENCPYGTTVVIQQ